MKTNYLIALFISLVFISSLAQAQKNASQITPVFVSVDWVLQNREAVKIFDLSEQLSYRKFHIPGAVWVDYQWLIKPEEGLELSGGPAHMSSVLSKLGVSNNDRIVLYDDIGGLEASRLYWELAMLNHKNVVIMDGGTIAWVLKGYPVTQKASFPTPKFYQPSKTTLTSFFYADKQDVLAAIKDPKVHLIDTRNQQEYLGNPTKERTGHIPSAILFPWDAVIDPLNGFRQRSPNELSAFFKKLGIENKQHGYILYCNTGHRAARLWAALKSQGYHKIKLYDASMQEWEIDPDLPLITGFNP